MRNLESLVCLPLCSGSPEGEDESLILVGYLLDDADLACGQPLGVQLSGVARLCAVRGRP